MKKHKNGGHHSHSKAKIASARAARKFQGNGNQAKNAVPGWVKPGTKLHDGSVAQNRRILAQGGW